jgi:hypothetical protein
MSWARILEFDAGPIQPLRQRIDSLFHQQRQSWPTFRAGEAGLEHLRTKTLVSDGDSVVVQLNVGRRPSVLAKTDPESVAARACFLCPESMPPEERGAAFEDLVVLPNPNPCLTLHCTIAGREHVPQCIAGRVDTFLRLARALGHDLAVTYNGPRCGASAPDHFHFQCVRRDGLPLFGQLPRPALGMAVTTHSNFGRQMLVFSGCDAARVRADMERVIGSLGRHADPGGEPLLNLAGCFDGECFTVLLFPRTRHRPASYYVAGAERLIISPGVLEMCGLFVVTDPSDFERIDADTVRSIYEEVCAPA